jgi:phosphoglycolate phosphatase-like HAD superfamily hydrolase
MKLSTRAVFWDIDGTLLVTGRAGLVAWQRAYAAVTERTAFPSVRTDGLTDHQIAAFLLDTGSRDVAATEELQAPPAAGAAQVARLVVRYEEELVSALPLRQGRVLDNVEAVLSWLRADRPDLVCWLVTGNTRRGAAAKLRHYGLDRYFVERSDGVHDGGRPELAGSFSERAEPRALIAQRALGRAQVHLPGLLPGEALIVGDTPHDVESAHAIGVPVLAVASNTHSLEELAALRPWQARAVLPAVEEFARLLASGL